MTAASQSWLSDASFVSTLQPTRRQRRTASAVAIVSLAVFLVAAPFAKTPLHPVFGFLPVYQSALVIFDLLTAALLLNQYTMLRTRALLLLAAGYVFSAVMASAHALSFPGLFAPAGVLGGGGQTTAWLYFLWHGGCPIFVIAYARARREPHLPIGGSPAAGVTASIALGAGAALLLALLPTAGHDAMPSIMSGDWDAPAKLVVASVTWIIGVAALVLVWRTHSHTVLDLWLMVGLCVWTADTALAAVLNGARFDLGWYAGRVYGLLANAFVLGVLLLESAALYTRLAVAMGELQLAHRDLQAFSGSLAHDLQQPITTITSFSQVLRRGGNLSPSQVSYLDRIIAGADMAKKMIAALLDFARLGQAPVRKESVDLNHVVAEARNAVTHGNTTRVDWKIAPLPTVQADSALLLIAFINLLSNAVKYSAGSESPRISVTALREPGGHYAIEVRDNGVGFDMTQAKRLFSPFERLHSSREFEGTGMGLANVRRIMEKLGGTVRAQAEPGQGACFTVVLA